MQSIRVYNLLQIGYRIIAKEVSPPYSEHNSDVLSIIDKKPRYDTNGNEAQ